MGAQGVWGTWVIGHRGYGVQGLWATSAMGQMGNGVQGYGQMGNGTHGRSAPKISKRCQDVKKMSSSQKDVKCQIVKHLDYGGGSQKKKIDIMRFTHIDVNFDVRYEGHQNCPKILSMNILRVFSDHHL